MIKIKPLVSALALATYATYGAGAIAQDDLLFLEEVVVTAQKRAKSIQEVPISITAFSGDFLEKSGIKDMADVAAITPNFNIASTAEPASNRIQIRGIGAAGNNAIEPSVGVFIDGVYYPRPGAVLGMLMDVNSFEVLRGPQGTLFGRNTVAGALNVTTRNPSEESEGKIELGYGDYGLYELGASFNGSITDSVNGRLAIKSSSRDGYGYNTLQEEEYGEKEELLVRGKLSFDINEQFSVLVTADYGEIDSGGVGPAVLNSTVTPEFVAANLAVYGDSPVTEDSYDWNIHNVNDDHYSDEQQGLSFDANYEFDNGMTLRSVTALREWEADNTRQDSMAVVSLIAGDTHYKTDTLSQEFHLMSAGDETVDWMAGLFYYEEEYDIYTSRDFGEGFCDPTIATSASFLLASCQAGVQEGVLDIDFQQELESIAVFGQATWNITDAWDTTAGLRWTKDQKQADYVAGYYNPAAFILHANESVLGMELEESQVTWFANVNYRITEDLMLFATASTGYKSGGFNSQSSGPAVLGLERRTFDAETTTNYELGLKSTLLDGAMTANATLFRMDIDDFQDRAFDGLSFIVVNAGKLRQQGVEVDINWAPIEQLRMVAGIGFMDSEYLEFDGAPALPGGGVQDLAGERRTYSPEWMTSLSADWTQSFGNDMVWFVGGSYSWTDDQNVGSSSNNNPQSMQDAYAVVNARIGIAAESGDWDVTLFGNNLTDEGTCQTIFDQAFGGAQQSIDAANNTSVMRCAVSAPTTWTLKGNYHF